MSAQGIVAEPDFSWADVLLSLKRRWLLLSVVALLVGSAIGALGHLRGPNYRAQAILVPNSQLVDEGAGSPLLGRYASALGLGGAMGAGGGAVVNEAKAALLSERFLLEVLERRPELRRAVGERLELALDRPEVWAVDRNRYRAASFVKQGVLALREDNEAGLVFVSAMWTEPSMAATWANEMVAELNQRQRAQAVSDATRLIAQLQKEVGETQQVEVKQRLFQLIEQQIGKRALARAREDYVFRVINPAIPPLWPLQPHGVVLVVLAIVMGLIAGAAAALFAEFFGVASARRKSLPREP